MAKPYFSVALIAFVVLACSFNTEAVPMPMPKPMPKPVLMKTATLVYTARKDATLPYEERGMCTTVEALAKKACPSYCPWCNLGRDTRLEIQTYARLSVALVGFNLGARIPKGAIIKKCVIKFPNPIGGPPAFKGPLIEAKDVSYLWNETRVTYSSRPKPTSVGSYGIYAPYGNNTIDVTKGCKARGTNYNSLSVLLSVNLARVPSSVFITPLFAYPSKEAGKPAQLFVTMLVPV